MALFASKELTAALDKIETLNADLTAANARADAAEQQLEQIRSALAKVAAKSEDEDDEEEQEDEDDEPKEKKKGKKSEDTDEDDEEEQEDEDEEPEASAAALVSKLTRQLQQLRSELATAKAAASEEEIIKRVNAALAKAGGEPIKRDPGATAPGAQAKATAGDGLKGLKKAAALLNQKLPAGK
jgi:Nucleosome binding factor SPN, SPT16 subunit